GPPRAVWSGCPNQRPSTDRAAPRSCPCSAAPLRFGSIRRPPRRRSSVPRASEPARRTGKERIMISETTAWPRKTRELRHQLFDSAIWNEFRFRADDVVIATYAKAGTTWTQQIVAQLIFGGRDGIDVASLSPWLDMR